MIEFAKTESRLILIYEVADFGPSGWVKEELEQKGEVCIARAFYFSTDNISTDVIDDGFGEREETTESHAFVLGNLEAGYFKIAKERLGIEHDVYLAAALRINSRTFIASRNISIFRRIARVTAEDIYIGGDNANAIPVSDFENLLRSFPNSTELDRYADAKVARIVGEYFETTSQAEKRFEDFLSKRGRAKTIIELPDVYQFEVSKYAFIHDKILELLKDESSFSENEWRDLMLQFILLIFPKYVCVLRNLLVKDYYSSPNRAKNRYIDIALLDANGHIDIIEIKKPFDNCLVSGSEYRGNFTPRKELSGTIMQAEKYLFHLSKWGIAGEAVITKRQAANLPAGMTVKITNPKAIVIAGRSNNLSTQQLFDFELIKRKFGNIIDILSYDDLLNRLSRTMEQFNKTA